MSQPTPRPAARIGGRNGITDGWATVENDALTRLYPTALRATVEAALPGRSWNAMALQAQALGLKRRRYWNSERLTLLRTHYPTKGAAHVAALLGIAPAIVTKQASLQGIARIITPKPPRPPRKRTPMPKPAPQPAPKSVKPVVEAVAQHQPARLSNLIAQKSRKKKRAAGELVHTSITVAEFQDLPQDHPGRPHYLRDGARGWDQWLKNSAA